MRLVNKLSILSKIGIRKVPSRFPFRFLRLKRPKWHKLRKYFLVSLKQKVFLTNYETYRLKFKSWERVKRSFLEVVDSNRFLRFLGGDLKMPQKNLDQDLRKDMILNYLLKKEFRVDVLLWNLNFFPSRYSARQFICSNKVLLNGKSCLPSTLLSMGDVLTFNDVKILSTNFFASNANRSPNQNLLSFLEVDYYRGVVVVVKDISTLNYFDFCLFSSDYIDARKLSSRFSRI